MSKILEETENNLVTKELQAIYYPPTPHMVGNGFRVHNFFPSGTNIKMDRMSPFFLMDYNSKLNLPPSKIERGVGVHPHRGFETVTIAYHGKVEHHDSKGNHGIIGEGDVQWMTASKGILHKEYLEKEFNQKGGDFQMVQLWVNLPAKDKMSPPKYQPLLHNEMGKYLLPNDEGVINIIAGEYNGVKGPAYTFSPINLFDIRLKDKAKVKLSIPKNYNTGILIIDGSVKVNNLDTVKLNHFALFQNNGTEILLEALEDCKILLLSGEPINEPIAPYGPFLMNTYEEINQAIYDFNNGDFGYLAD
ncbi:MAG: pirin family protein [Candidatus Sericytochromatia bacterium]